VNAENFRIFRTYFYWNQAKSLEDLIAIQRREAAIPWVNTVAIGKGDGRVWYGDVGVVPNVPDELRRLCTTPLAKAFAGLDPYTPFLDGSRIACEWRSDAVAKQPGTLPVSAQPWLLRQDYVANMNDSYWLTNVHQPLEGFPSVLGGEREALGLRSRLGHRIALDLLRSSQPSAEALTQRLMQEVLTPRAYSAELYKDGLLGNACATASVEVASACRILKQWPNTANADDRGALLWEAFWVQLSKIPAKEFYSTAFLPDKPLETPGAPKIDDSKVVQALAAAVASLEAKGVPLDAPLRSRRFVESAGRRWPIFGGCHPAGYFTVACSGDSNERMGLNSTANSYLQVVRFGPHGAEAYTLLAHGQDESAIANGRGTAPVARYSRKDWLHFPFREEQIARDPQLKRITLR
jgi:acyl-homoserine-lactone acylase